MQRAILALTLITRGCKRIAGARSEKDITRVSGTLSTGSIPVGRTSYGYTLNGRVFGYAAPWQARHASLTDGYVQSVIVSVARKDLVQPGSKITVEFLKSIQLSFDFVPEGRAELGYFTKEACIFLAQAREFVFEFGLLRFQIL